MRKIAAQREKDEKKKLKPFLFARIVGHCEIVFHCTHLAGGVCLDLEGR